MMRRTMRPAGVIPGGKGRSVLAVAAAVGAGAAVPIAATEVLQSGDSLAALRCRQAIASTPPGCTPAQLARKSRGQVRLIALCCSGVGVEGATAGAGGGGTSAGFATAVVTGGFGATAGAGAGVGAGFATAVPTGGFGVATGAGAAKGAGAGFATAVAAGGVAADGAGAGGAETVAAVLGAGVAALGTDAAGGGFTSAGAGAGIVALTAVLQAGARLPTFFCRQVSASLPPGVTPEHFDMKSERQFERIALCCSGVTCALAEEKKVRGPAASSTAQTMAFEAVG
jgi:hypothetical protein